MNPHDALKGDIYIYTHTHTHTRSRFIEVAVKEDINIGADAVFHGRCGRL